MEQKFGKNSIDIEVLREFCEREGKMVEYRKGEQLEREGDPARWFGFVTEGCFKYVTHGISDDREYSPGIVEHLDLQDIASFLNVTPKTISMIRKDITFGKD